MVSDHEKIPSTIGIVGLGLIGGSIAKDLKNLNPSPDIAAYDPDATVIDSAIAAGVISRGLPLNEIGKFASLTIIASPLDQVASNALEIRDSMVGSSDNAASTKIVMDVGSVKRPITNVFSVLSSREVEFVATHPMAGTEFIGFGHARKDLFRAKPWIVCEHENNSASVINQVVSFIDILGGHVRQIDADTHDRHAAAVSHSVIALSNLLFNFISDHHPEALELAGDGFSSTTRLASGNPSMHAAITKENSGFIHQYLSEFQVYLNEKLVLFKSGQDTYPFYEANANRRNAWIKTRKNS